MMIPAQTGIAFELSKGERLKVTDRYGQQVADLFCYSKAHPKSVLSSGRSIDYEDTFLFSKGNFLYAYDGRPMLKILEDTCGRHDFLVTPCSLQMFQMINKNHEYHPSCQENLEKSLSRYDVDVSQIGTTFNIFMNVEFTSAGKIHVGPPLSKPDDYIIFEAQMNLVVGLTACSDEGSNNGHCKPIEFEILPA